MVGTRGTAPVKSTTPLIVPVLAKSGVAAGAAGGGAVSAVLEEELLDVGCVEGCDLQPANASRSNKGSMFFILNVGKIFPPERFCQFAARLVSQTSN
jgi:hypothetical protein